MKPGAERRILNPRMLRTDVICDLVLNDFYAGGMRFLDQFAQCREITKAVFNCVIIDRVIAVIIRVRTPRLAAAIDAVPVVGPWC